MIDLDAKEIMALGMVIDHAWKTGAVRDPEAGHTILRLGDKLSAAYSAIASREPQDASSSPMSDSASGRENGAQGDSGGVLDDSEVISARA